MEFLWGTLVIIIGILIMRYTHALVMLFGKVDWAEQKLSSGLGGTYAMYKIVGVILCILGLLYMFGSAEFLVKPFAPVFGG